MILILKGKLLNYTFFINQNMVELTNDFTVYRGRFKGVRGMQMHPPLPASNVFLRT